MTTRLKILSFGLIVSLIVAVTDYVNRNNERPKPSVRNKKSSVSPKRQSYKSKITRQKKIIEDASDKNQPSSETYGEFLPIPEEILEMSSWNRNPFIKQKQTNMGAEPEILNNRQLEAEQPRMADFEMLKIESVAKLGSNVFVIINGKRYGIGDRIDRYLIEDIYDDRVIFLLGDTRVMKGVGK
jgi:hypothetical protein|tara:strand:+ start:1209 stop:1760 length:552 start_codon:yes stop_codon:yes gene_type:complete